MAKLPKDRRLIGSLQRTIYALRCSARVADDAPFKHIINGKYRYLQQVGLRTFINIKDGIFLIYVLSLLSEGYPGKGSRAGSRHTANLKSTAGVFGRWR